MTRIRTRSEQIRQYILRNVEKHPGDITRMAAERFGVTRQAINKHVKMLVEQGSLIEKGKTRNRVYSLAPLEKWTGDYVISSDLAEDVVWRNDVRSQLGAMPENVSDIWHYGFTEMFNNARNVYEADLENALAGAREEFSGLGLDPGSSTRAAGLARVGATEAARFNTAQQEVARQSFENAQNRSLQALGYAPALSEAFARPQDRMIQAGSVLGQLGLDTARTQADILPTLGNLAQVPFAEALAGGQLDLQGMGLGTDALTRIADMMKTPFEQGLANEQLGLSGTNLAASLMPTLAELTGKPLQEMMGIAGLGLEGTGIQASTLPAFTSASQIPFEQALAQYGAGLQGQQTGISALPAFMDLFNNPARLAESAFNMGETARGAEQGTIDRMLMEYGRTQNAMLPFMLQLISGTPRMDIGYGPSTLSQLGSFAQGVGSLIPGIGK